MQWSRTSFTTLTDFFTLSEKISNTEFHMQGDMSTDIIVSSIVVGGTFFVVSTIFVLLLVNLFMLMSY